MIVVTEENKDQINSALTAKLLDFNINIPSLLNDIKLLDLDKLNNASADVSNKLNVDTWFNNTIACMDISAGCQGCNETQTDFGECKGGCFNINTGCSDCEGTDAVPVCTSCDNGESCEQAPTVIEVCTSCDEGCFVCDQPCFRCDGGCQGGQTCHSCNNGEGCITGCENNFHAGCGSCELDFQLCATGYTPACGRDQAVIRCQSACNTGCVGDDVNYCKEEHKVCSGNQSQICDEYQQFQYPSGCNVNNKACLATFAGSCSGSFSTTGTWACATGFSCYNNYTVNDVSVTCPSNYKGTVCSTCNTVTQTCPSNVTAGNCGPGYRNCTSDFELINCPSGYKATQDASGGYVAICPNSYTNSDGTSCVREYQVEHTTGNTGAHCNTGYISSQTSCVSNYAVGVVDGHTVVECPNNFSNGNGYNNCSGGYKSCSAGNITCNNGYSKPGGTNCSGGYSTNGTDINCPSNYKGNGVDCPSNYGQDPQVVCTNCNGGRNRVCTSCVNGQAPVCSVCFGMTDNANCQSGCVLGQPATCDANCVTVGNGGCNDCEGCDSGCNNNVSCDSTFRYDENGKIDCKVTYTDTSCGQTCVNGFNSNTDCFQCVSCNSECENCEVSCQGGCQNCETTCQTYCEAVCQSCEGGCNTACVGCDATCNTSCYNGCDSCDGACDINCENCQGECIIGVGECSSTDGCASGQSQCAGAWCGTSQGCQPTY